MAITAVLGDGATISIGGTPLGEVESIKYGGGGFDAVDVSNLSSVGIRRFLQTASADGGEITIEYCSAALWAGTPGELAVVIALSDATSITFTAFLLSSETNIPLRAKVTHSMKLKITAAAGTTQAYKLAPATIPALTAEQVAALAK